MKNNRLKIKVKHYESKLSIDESSDVDLVDMKKMFELIAWFIFGYKIEVNLKVIPQTDKNASTPF